MNIDLLIDLPCAQFHEDDNCRSGRRTWMQGARCAGCCPFDFIFFDWSGTLALKIPVSGKEEKLAHRLRSLYAALEDLITREYPSQSLPSFEKVFQNTVLARWAFANHHEHLTDKQEGTYGRKGGGILQLGWYNKPNVYQGRELFFYFTKISIGRYRYT